jgi:hypothetical protein
MRRIFTTALTVLMAFSLMLSLSSTASANAITGGGYNSSYSGESVFTNQAAGTSGQFSAIFFNSGTQSWAPGVVGLLICDASKTTCNVAGPNQAYASGWFSGTVYATVSASVPSGSNGFFVYNFTVPAGTAPGTAATFNGDVGLISNGTELRPEGYFQINTTPGATGGLQISPTSAALPVGGQQQFTVTGAPAGSTTTWTVNGGCGAVTNQGLFAATATNSPTQPCSVVASAGGSSASAAVTVFGPATAIRCSATKSTIPADGGNTITTVQGTLIDANGNVVSNDNSTSVTFTNNTPAVLGDRNSTQPSPRTAQSGVASKDYTAIATGNNGTGIISLSSGSLTGCSQTITVTGPGAATQLAASFYLGTISADGTSKSVLEVDVTDANGVIVSSDNSDTITISRNTGSSVCAAAGAGSAGPTTVSAGSAFFTITSTATPGTCQWAATTNATGVAGATATLTTVITGAPQQLAIQGNASPKAADGAATLRVTVALRDANNNPDTTPADQVTVTATLGSGCTGTKADGSSGTVTFSDGTTAAKTAATGSYTGVTGASTNYARFVFKSTFATAGCTVNFTDGSSVNSTTATIVFTAGGPAGVACAFSPAYIVSDGSSTSIGTVSMVDGQKNLATQGTFSVSFSRTSGSSTTLLTSSPQSTSNGVASFTVRSSTAQVTSTDTYTATTTVAGTSTSGTCNITQQLTLP